MPFDVLVIGGGITGCGVARDASLRGLRVALVERDDFGSGTSSRSSRLVHGGLRYLEHGELHLVFESSRERRTLMRIAPHLVRPLRFVWPVYERARVPRWKLGAGLFLYDALSLFRNVSSHSRLDAPEVMALEPALRQEGLLGGATYFDAHTDDVRLTLANALDAAMHGATVTNHVEVKGVESGFGAAAVDKLTGRTLRIPARAIVSAAGPWSDAVRRLGEPSARPALRRTKGAHIAVPRTRLLNANALTLLSPADGRVMFVIPDGDRAIIGTTDTDYDGPADGVRATRQDVTYLLDAANAFFPGAHLTPNEVISAWAGIRPLVADGGDDPGSISREHAIAWTAPRFLTVTGGKLTTYRAMAAEVVDAITRFLDREARPRAATDTMPLPGGDITSLAEEYATARSVTLLGPESDHLVRSYGSAWRDVWGIAQSDAALAARIAPPLPYLGAELRYAVEREMALTLADLLIRRTHIAFETRDHGVSVAPTAARIAAPLLRWTTEQIEEELKRYGEAVRRIFEIEDGKG
ncbi:MAG: glycerol-3-phosphate dehydrogenase [Gemmatimonadaceae bacterium]